MLDSPRLPQPGLDQEAKDMDALAMTATDVVWGIPIGTEVFDIEGEPLGKVTSANTVNLIVTSGWLMLTDYEISMAHVGQFDDGKLFLKLTKKKLLGEG